MIADQTPGNVPNPAADASDNVQEDRTSLKLQYAAASGVATDETGTQIQLPGNILRPPVRLCAKVKDPVLFREAMAAVHSIVGSDYRYVPKDRSAYQAYRQLKQETASASAWEAQQAYFQWLSRNDPLAWVMLDPVISVHPDGVFFEVFSKDEGVYANLSVANNGLEIEGKPAYGTTNIDFSQNLLSGILQMRSYRATQLRVGQDAVKLTTSDPKSESTEPVDEVLEKQIRIPDSWLRGFLQVQSAATLPKESFTLQPMDLYNVMRQLRLNGDQKGKRRGVRIELVPGERPNLVLEPWETLIPSGGDIYRGKQAKVVRVWGRRRLLLLRRMLPFAETIDVHLLGSGLPSFWVLRAGDYALTLGMTGFTAANWSQAINFDLLLPRHQQDSAAAKPLEKVVKHLAKAWHDTPAGLTKATGGDGASLLETVQLGCQQGRLMYDLANDAYRLRPLTEEPLDLTKLEYRSSRERTAYDLLSRKSAVKIASISRVVGLGSELTGKVDVKEDKREYRPQLVLTEEGSVTRAECTCSFFRKQGLKHGPCAHLIALRLAHSLAEAEQRKSGKARQTITAETRTYSRRTDQGETMVQLTLAKQQVRIRWGMPGETMRLQRLQFNSVDAARADYLSRAEKLEKSGYLDATAE